MAANTRQERELLFATGEETKQFIFRTNIWCTRSPTFQIHTWLDGEQFVIFGTGGNANGGSLFVLSLYDLYKKDISQVR